VNRIVFQQLTGLRIREARTLLLAGHFAGAYYVAGYAVECGLKACIARNVRRYDFPNKKLASDVFTHDLENLVRGAGLWPVLIADLAANANLQVNWAVVKDWSVESRYQAGTTVALARDMYSACTARQHGVLRWIRQRW
jgi:hypothetical protein